MITQLDCIPCLIRQAIESSKFCGLSQRDQDYVLREALRFLSEADFSASPPAIAQHLHRKLRALSGQDDPYRGIKDQFNAMAMSMTDAMRKMIGNSLNPMETAVRLAIAGNVIDCGAKTGLMEKDVRIQIERACEENISGDINEFIDAVSAAKKIMYITDNAGEIVFDRLLVEQIGADRVIIGVRGSAVINDATAEDARAAGLDTIACVIENGSDAPGTIIDECCDEFKKCFNESDLIISKGQGNYETLSHMTKNIFFLLKVKCPIISEHSGYPAGSHVILHRGKKG